MKLSRFPEVFFRINPKNLVGLWIETSGKPVPLNKYAGLMILSIGSVISLEYFQFASKYKLKGGEMKRKINQLINY